MESWTTILSEPRPGVADVIPLDIGSLILLSAKCDDGEQLAPVVAGYNDSGRTNCLLHPRPARTVPDPQDGRYNFRSGCLSSSCNPGLFAILRFCLSAPHNMIQTQTVALFGLYLICFWALDWFVGHVVFLHRSIEVV